MSKWTSEEVLAEATEVSDYGGTTAGEMLTAYAERIAADEAAAQATTCAGCGKHKNTPLRIDAMGGYVCLTCIDEKLSSLLGEFGYPDPPAQPPIDLAAIREVIPCLCMAYECVENDRLDEARLHIDMSIDKISLAIGGTP